MKAFMVDIKKWLIVLAVIFTGTFIGSQALAADSGINSTEGILDPFTLTATPREDTTTTTWDEEFMNESIINSTSSSTSPLPTLRPWIRVPFAPPMRSPFKPWWM